ncbi:hypothetical protein P5673_014336 [Acropora cervicornis]|uniref:Uncharacterized protein n=1 Tax=Acropora cervicornis TaxID=6130 RepID=A0AAD9QKJ7_ACRCE|nr:hypothetical protein P5673_014336 [Acropora cervicornis]
MGESQADFDYLWWFHCEILALISDTFMNSPLRYTVESSKSGYSYSYNPCRQFSLGPPEISDCYGDVAVCMWATNGARYLNIGRASSRRIGYEKDSERYRLEYSNTKTP